MKLVYLIGVPGAGKTSLFQALTRHWQGELKAKPFAHIFYMNGIIQLGRQREYFGGTDALSMNVQPIVLQWMQSAKAPLIIGEGDRLSNESFFLKAQDLGYTLAIWYLKTPDKLAAARREQRGSKQNETWIKGRESKVKTLAQNFVDRERILDGADSLELMANRILSYDLNKTPRN